MKRTSGVGYVWCFHLIPSGIPDYHRQIIDTPVNHNILCPCQYSVSRTRRLLPSLSHSWIASKLKFLIISSHGLVGLLMLCPTRGTSIFPVRCFIFRQRPSPLPGIILIARAAGLIFTLNTESTRVSLSLPLSLPFSPLPQCWRRSVSAASRPLHTARVSLCDIGGKWKDYAETVLNPEWLGFSVRSWMKYIVNEPQVSLFRWWTDERDRRISDWGLESELKDSLHNRISLPNNGLWSRRLLQVGVNGVSITVLT